MISINLRILLIIVSVIISVISLRLIQKGSLSVKEAFGLESDTQGFSAPLPLKSDLNEYTLYLVNKSKKEIYKKTISVAKSDDLDEAFSNVDGIE